MYRFWVNVILLLTMLGFERAALWLGNRVLDLPPGMTLTSVRMEREDGG